MQTCIDRYRKSNKMNSQITQYFQDYMFLGGIDVSGKPFHEDGAETAATISMQNEHETSESHVQFGGRFYDGKEEGWTVDFTGIAAGFFSIALPTLTALEDSAIIDAISVVENFLHYVQYHQVCPEYSEDIQRALQVAADAKIEWRLIGQFEELVPGRFNLAAAELFGVASSEDWHMRDFLRPENFDAKKVFYSVLALMGEKDLFVRICQGTPTVIKELNCVLELTKIIRPTEELAALFRQLTIGEGGNSQYVLPVGTAKFKFTTLQDGWYDPMADENASQGEEVTLFMETLLLGLLKPGMKIQVRLCQVDAGFYFLKSLVGSHPTFYTFLPQQLMRHFVPPRKNHRPGPSVYDENGIIDQLADTEFE